MIEFPNFENWGGFWRYQLPVMRNGMRPGIVPSRIVTATRRPLTPHPFKGLHKSHIMRVHNLSDEASDAAELQALMNTDVPFSGVEDYRPLPSGPVLAPTPQTPASSGSSWMDEIGKSIGNTANTVLQAKAYQLASKSGFLPSGARTMVPVSSSGITKYLPWIALGAGALILLPMLMRK